MTKANYDRCVFYFLAYGVTARFSSNELLVSGNVYPQNQTRFDFKKQDTILLLHANRHPKFVIQVRTQDTSLYRDTKSETNLYRDASSCLVSLSVSEV